MALFGDGTMSDQESLREYESEILSVAQRENIDLDAKLRIAQREIGFTVGAFVFRNSKEHGDATEALGKVVISDALRHWHLLQTLQLVYRDAFFRQMNDRYQEKCEQYTRLAEAARRIYMDGGVGLVRNPIDRAAPADCEAIAGPERAARTYFVSIGWSRDGAYGAPSAAVAVQLGNGERLRVRAPKSDRPDYMWNVYAGTEAGALFRQNQQPLAPNASWQEEAGELDRTVRAGTGQQPEHCTRASNVICRG